MSPNSANLSIVFGIGMLLILVLQESKASFHLYRSNFVQGDESRYSIKHDSLNHAVVLNKTLTSFRNHPILNVIALDTKYSRCYFGQLNQTVTEHFVLCKNNTNPATTNEVLCNMPGISQIHTLNKKSSSDLYEKENEPVSPISVLMSTAALIITSQLL